MPSSRRVRMVALALSNFLLPVALLTFASGFFPYKPVLPGLSTFDHVDLAEKQPDAKFDRIVFMVIDALRSDFVYGYGSGFEYTQSLIRSGFAIPFTAHATPPTVTMPRIKALTTGSVPSFADLILNIAESDTGSSLALQDTWLAQLRARPSGNLVFYGDDTWLKLFPSSANNTFFSRADGTSSFFVSDFTEVDHNVTRHLPFELARNDWNAMILHYLGLDHIGHKTGPQGPNMLPKQREMDSIVKKVYEAIESEDHHRNTLLVLAGDHGMNAGGNHGGSGPGETEPALLFASPKFAQMQRREQYQCPTAPKQGTEFHYFTKVQQSDLVPTLAGLMGFPVPKNSLGVFIPELAGLWEETEILTLLQQNARQILQIIEAMHGADSFQSAATSFQIASPSNDNEDCRQTPDGLKKLACLWTLATRVDQEMSAAMRATIDFLLEAQDTLSGTASSYNIPKMSIGMILGGASLLLALVSFPSLWPPAMPSLFFSAVCVLYGVMMFASSYVEEEQHLWYWLTPAWIVLLFGIDSRFVSASPRRRTGIVFATFALLATHRLAVRWNQTGQKHSGAPDIVHTLFPRAHILMWVLVLITFSYTGYLLARRAFGGLMAPEIAAVTSIVLIMPAIVFKLNFTQADAPELVQGLASQIRAWSAAFDLILQAQVTFAVLVAAMLVVVSLAVLSARASTNAGLHETGRLPSLAERLHHFLTLFLMMQTRTANIPLFLGFEIQRHALAYLLNDGEHPTAGQSKVATSAPGRPVMQIATSTLLLSHVYFFCMGGSNSISSIDLSNAYNGIANYNVVAVGVLLFASNWAGPIWWCSATVLLLIRSNEASAESSVRKTSAGERNWVNDERTKLREDVLKAITSPEQLAEVSAQAASTDGWRVYLSCMTTFIAAALVAVMAACTALRTHLFIWTVFSPKYLYAMAWSLGWHLIIDMGCGNAFFWLTKIR